MSIFKQTRYSQPQGPVEVDWASYPTCSLAVSQYYDFAAKALLSKTGTKLSPATNGIVTGFGPTSGVSSTDKVTTTLTRYAQRRTYLVVALANGSGAGGPFGRMFEKRTSGAQSELFFRDDTGGTSAYGRVFSGSAGQWSFPNPSAGQWHVYIVRYDSGSTSNVPVIWVDGVAKTLTVVSSPSGTPLDNSDPYTIGNRANDSLRNWSGQIALVSAFDSILTDAQCAALTANPWQLFAPIERQIWVPVSAGGGGTSQTIAFTLDDLTASVSQTLSHSQSTAFTLDGISSTVNQAVTHSQSLSTTLDDVAASISQTASPAKSQSVSFVLEGISASITQVVGSGNFQNISFTLDGISSSVSQTLVHSQTSSFSLEDVSVSVSQTARHGQALAISLEDISIGIAQSVATSKQQTLSITLDGVSIAINQAAPSSPLTDAEMRDMYDKVLLIYANMLTVPKFLALK